MTAVLAVLPDTQTMAAHHPEFYRAIGDWLERHAADEEIDAVLHVGDVVDDGREDPAQLICAREVHDRIVAAGLPLYVAAGNHDDDDLLSGSKRSLRMFEAEVSSIRHLGAPWICGTFTDDPASNLHGTLDLPGLPLLVLVLEFSPRREVAAWAVGVLAEHPDRCAVVVTHSYLNGDGRLMAPGAPNHPDIYPATMGDLDGEGLWQVLRRTPNVRAVFSGHQVPETISYRVDARADGRGVLASFQNWQFRSDGGGGRIRLVRIDDGGARITMEVVNTATGEREHDPGYDAELDLDAQLGTIFTQTYY